MLDLINWSKLSEHQRRTALARPVNQTSQLLRTQVDQIISRVRNEGDAALYELTKQFDRVSLRELRVSRAEVDAAYDAVAPETVNALKVARENITRFHTEQVPKPIKLQTGAGITCEKRFTAIERVGLYVPGGSAPLVSTVLMLAIPAQIAGCSLKVLATPPRLDGSIDPNILVASDLCGVDVIFKIGGAQAIAALAFGTASVPAVDKIFGPGNSWVTQAKLAVAQDPGGAAFDIPAGPSEVMVVIDETSDVDCAAADLLSQAEHGPDSQVILVSQNLAALQATQVSVANQLEQLERKSIAAKALKKSRMVLASSEDDVMQIVNNYAPEHLILLQQGAQLFAQGVKHAGSIFVGPWTPESVGDYASGTNHVLPTYGFARQYSGLGTEAFLKSMTIQELSREGLRLLGPVVEQLASVEGLQGHRQAVSLRLSRLRSGDD